MHGNPYEPSLDPCRSDDGGEFRAMQCYFKEQRIQWETSAPYAQQQNGVADRSNRTILEKDRTMLIHANLSEAHWAEAPNTAIYLANRTPTSSLPNYQTPYEAWHGKKPNIQHLRVFGLQAQRQDGSTGMERHSQRTLISCE